MWPYDSEAEVGTCHVHLNGPAFMQQLDFPMTATSQQNTFFFYKDGTNRHLTLEKPVC